MNVRKQESSTGKTKKSTNNLQHPTPWIKFIQIHQHNCLDVFSESEVGEGTGATKEALVRVLVVGIGEIRVLEVGMSGSLVI